ncbi:hypothetical protein GCM10009788_26620 [Nocardioides humi]|uniref:Lipopolysaccharide assembly protein A domain-containing protein n=1 Tax=Nocardioides humi TaxID=449461 RepID=A0ABN2ALX2_9ACTN
MANQEQKTSRISPRAVAGAVLAVLALVFVFQNTGEGRIEFLFWELTMPAWIWLLVVFAAGLAVGSLFPWLHRRKGD